MLLFFAVCFSLFLCQQSSLAHTVSMSALKISKWQSSHCSKMFSGLSFSPSNVIFTLCPMCFCRAFHKSISRSIILYHSVKRQPFFFVSFSYYARSVQQTFRKIGKADASASASDCRQNAFGQHSRSVFLVLGSKSVYLINNKHFWVPLFPFLAIIFASFFRFMQANVSPTFISIRAFPIICV